jgi:hypothetical protein
MAPRHAIRRIHLRSAVDPQLLQRAIEIVRIDPAALLQRLAIHRLRT